MLAVLIGFLFITSAAFILPYMMAGENTERGISRGIGAASITAVVYVIIVGFAVNGQMTREQFLKMKTVRFAIFLWIVIFPILFIALPVLEMVTGERENEIVPLWAFGIWVFGPWAVSILWKWFGGEEKE